MSKYIKRILHYIIFLVTRDTWEGHKNSPLFVSSGLQLCTLGIPAILTQNSVFNINDLATMYVNQVMA